MLKKLKSLVLDDTVYIAVLLVIVSVGSFGLGKMSVKTAEKSTNSMKETKLPTASSSSNLMMLNTATDTAINSQAVNLLQPTETPLHNFVASKAGTKYHALDCPGAKQIKETNKIYFISEDEAEASGYTRAANCPKR